MADVRADQIRLVPARHHAGCAHQHRAPAQTHAKIESKRRARTYANPVEMVENANNALIHKIADWLDSAYLRRKTCSARAGWPRKAEMARRDSTATARITA